MNLKNLKHKYRKNVKRYKTDWVSSDNDTIDDSQLNYTTDFHVEDNSDRPLSERLQPITTKYEPVRQTTPIISITMPEQYQTQDFEYSYPISQAQNQLAQEEMKQYQQALQLNEQLKQEINAKYKGLGQKERDKLVEQYSSPIKQTNNPSQMMSDVSDINFNYEARHKNGKLDIPVSIKSVHKMKNLIAAMHAGMKIIKVDGQNVIDLMNATPEQIKKYQYEKRKVKGTDTIQIMNIIEETVSKDWLLKYDSGQVIESIDEYVTTSQSQDKLDKMRRITDYYNGNKLNTSKDDIEKYQDEVVKDIESLIKENRGY